MPIYASKINFLRIQWNLLIFTGKKSWIFSYKNKKKSYLAFPSTDIFLEKCLIEFLRIFMHTRSKKNLYNMRIGILQSFEHIFTVRCNQ